MLWAATCWLAAPGIEREVARQRANSPSPASALLTLRRDGQRIVLRGRLTGEARQAIDSELRAAGFGGEIADDVVAAAGLEPSGIDEAMRASARALARLSGGEAVIGADSLSLTGVAVDFGSYNAIRDAMRARPGDKRIVTLDVTPPDADPFGWSAERQGDGLDLSGFVPSETLRAELLRDAESRMPGLRVTDRMQTAGGASRDLAFGEAARFALAQLQRLESGRVELAGIRLAVTGAGQDRDALAAIGAAMRAALPAGLTAGDVSLSALAVQPYIFAARRREGFLTLTGYVPDEGTRARILDAGRRAFLAEQIVDNLHLGDGAPPTFIAGVTFGLEHLARLASGEAAISGTSVRIGGEALYRQSGEQTRSLILARAPPGWTSSADIAITTRERVFEPELCQELLSEAAQKEPIQFEAKKAALSPEARERVSAIAALVKRCGSASLTIGAGGESGEAEAGASLARSRVETVIAALVASGIAPGRLRPAPPPVEADKGKGGPPAVTFTVER